VEQAERVRGLLSQVKGVTQTADQALLLGDRAMFLMHRMPFLIRAQARLGVQETMSDTLGQLSDFERMLDRMPASRAMVDDISHMTTNAANAAHETRMLLAQLEPFLTKVENLTTGAGGGDASGPDRGASVKEILASSERLTDKAVTILREIRALAPDQPGHVLDALEHRSDRIVRRWIGYLVLLGAAWAILFWGGYFVVKRFSS
jgi:hypothetical protein